MKHFFKENKRSILLYSIVAIVAITVYFLFLEFDRLAEIFQVLLSLLAPFLIGFAIAYLLNPVMVFLERTVYKRIGSKQEGVSKLKRTCSIFTTYVLVFAFISCLIVLLIPQIVSTVESLLKNVPVYIQQFSDYVTAIFQNNHWDMEWLQQVMPLPALLENAKTFITACFGWLLNVPVQLTTGVTNMIVGIIISIYFLYDKERFITSLTKVVYVFLPKKKADRVMEISRLTDHTFSRYIMGQIIDSAIVGLITFPFMLLIYPPYALLISVIIAVTNVIPFFGPFIGAVPSALLILLVAPDKFLWFIIFVFVMQQFDGNVLCPKIVGETTGVSPIWVLFGILVGGKILGFLGMIIGVPFVAVSYTLFRNYVDKKYQEKTNNELEAGQTD